MPMNYGNYGGGGNGPRNFGQQYQQPQTSGGMLGNMGGGSFTDPAATSMSQSLQNFWGQQASGNKPLQYDDPNGSPASNGPQPGAFNIADRIAQVYGALSSNGMPAGPTMPQFNGGRPNGQPNMANQWRPTPGRFDWRTMRNPLTPEQGADNAMAERSWGLGGIGYNFGGGGQPPIGGGKPPGFLGPPIGGGNSTDPYTKDPYGKG